MRATVSIILNTCSIDSLRPMMFENWCDRPSDPLQQDVLLPKLAVLDFLANLHLQQIDVERLAQIVAGAEPHRFDCGVGRRKRGDHDPEDVLVDALRGAQHLDTAQVRHLDVGNQQIDRLRARASPPPRVPLSASSTSYPSRRSTIASSSRIDRSSSTTRMRGGRRSVAVGAVSVTVRHVSAVARAGSRTDTVVPAPGCELTWISPL